MEKARSAALRALALDEGSALAHAALSQVLWRYDRDWEAGRRELERAVEISPNDPLVLDRYSHYLFHLGRHDDAIAAALRAVAVAPLDPRIRTEYATRFVQAGRFERGREELLRVIESAPDLPEPYVSLAVADLKLDLAEEWSWSLAKIYEHSVGVPAWFEELSGSSREGQMLEERIRAFLTLAEQHRDQVPPVLFAGHYAHLGENDLAFEWLERMYESRTPFLVNLRAAAVWDPLRSDPRWDDLMRRIGFPES